MLAGVTVMDEPEPADVVPQPAEYHCQVAPETNEPPDWVRVVDLPWQMVLVPVIEVGAVLPPHWAERSWPMAAMARTVRNLFNEL